DRHGRRARLLVGAGDRDAVPQDPGTVGARMIRHLIRAMLGLAAILAVVPAVAADLAHGQQVFAACAACHTEKPDAIGPSLKGVGGRKSAALDDFRYSAPLR